MAWKIFNRILIAAAVAGACISSGGAQRASGQTAPATTAAIRITSAAFHAGQPIPAACTCDEADMSPPLEWEGVPAEAKSLALICDDPDAPSGTWVHWVIYNLPPALKGLPEKTATTATLPNGAEQGVNDFKRTGYSGPCPPPGKTHRYFFKLYALDAPPVLKPGATKAELLHAMAGHIIAEGQITGTYRRKE